MNTSTPPDITAAAVLFSRQFAIMLSAGVSIVRTLQILESEAPAPYAEAMPTIRLALKQGRTLEEAIAGMPALFPAFYRVMIKAGEVGGMLDITLTRAADLLHDDWTLSQMAGIPPLLMAQDDVATEWQRLPPAHRTLHLLLFCRAWGSMLSAGVPILQAMEVAAASLDAQQRREVLSARQLMKDNSRFRDVVAHMTFLPASAQTLLTIGMDAGDLDILLLKAAELFQHQLIFQRQRG